MARAAAVARKARPGASRRRPRAATAPAYHHGDLRRALLDATEAVLEEAGVEGFTLREVARRAGVSHGAPAHHFGDVRGLLSAFSAESFAGLAEHMARHRAAAAPTPFEQLVATGVAYVEYALQHRARFQLMFRSDRLAIDSAPLQQAGHSAYGHLVQCVQALAGPEAAPAAVEQRIALAWSMVHGYATLLLDNAQFAAGAGPDAAQRLARLRAMLALTQSSFVPAR